MKFICFISGILFSVLLHAAELSGEGNYYFNTVSDKLSIFYSSNDRYAAEYLYATAPSLINYYEQSFGYTLDQRLNVILASTDNHQIQNGFSTQMPFNMTMYYGGGAADPDYFASISWIDLLSSHEITHDFQLNAKQNIVSSYAHKLFGNAPFVMPIIPIFIYPNQFLPNYILEGNAVLNETQFNNGGRLFSGAQRAIAFAFFKAGKFTPTNMFNQQDRITFPFGNKPYGISAYFHAYLAEKYGLQTVNSFFKYNSTKAWMVLALDDSYRAVFGKGYNELFNNFLEAYRPLYSNIKLLQGKTIDQAFFSSRLSRSNNKILFLARHYAGEKRLFEIDCQTENITKKSGQDWVNGKPFYYHERLYTAASLKTDYNQIHFGLFDQQRKGVDYLQGQVVQDILGDKVLYIDGRKSYASAQLFMNGEFISVTNSSAIFDASGNIYYFHNRGKMRILYRNRIPLYQFQGYWGFPINVINDRVYFVAGTRSGATIFSVKQQQVRRESPANNILDAKMLNENKFVAKVVTANNYEFKLAKTKPLEGQPYVYEYSFVTNVPVKLLQKKSLEHSSPYNSLLGLSFSSINLMGAYAPASSEERDQGVRDRYNISIAANFSDKLLLNSASIGYVQTEEIKLAKVTYMNSRYRLQYGVMGIDIIENNEAPINRYLDSSSGYGGSLFLHLPLLVYGRHVSSADLNAYMDYDDAHKNPFIFSLNYNYAEGSGASPFALWSYSLTSYLKYDQQSYYDAVGSGDLWLWGAWVQVQRSFENEFSLSLSAHWSQADRGNTIKIDDDIDLYGDMSDFHLKAMDFFYYAKKVYSSTLRFSKLLHLSSYHSWFPFSLRRESIFLEAEAMKLNYADDNNIVTVSPTFTYQRDSELLEIRAGFNFDLLVAHLTPVLFNVSYIYNSNNGGVNSIYFGTSTAF